MKLAHEETTLQGSPVKAMVIPDEAVLRGKLTDTRAAVAEAVVITRRLLASPWPKGRREEDLHLARLAQLRDVLARVARSPSEQVEGDG